MTAKSKSLDGPFRHLIGGEAAGRPHAVGDRVDGRTPERKVREWLAAGIIESIPQKKEKA